VGTHHDSTIYHREDKHATLMQQKEEEESEVHEMHMRHIEEAINSQIETRRRMISESWDGDGAEGSSRASAMSSDVWDTDNAHTLGTKKSNIGAEFERFRLGGEVREKTSFKCPVPLSGRLGSVCGLRSDGGRWCACRSLTEAGRSGTAVRRGMCAGR
jgi:hypothetical protein